MPPTKILGQKGFLRWLVDKNVHITVVTRPKDDFPKKDHHVLQKALNILSSSGIHIMLKSNIHQKFAIMDQKIVWYGSINLLCYGSAQESIMRIEAIDAEHSNECGLVCCARSHIAALEQAIFEDLEAVLILMMISN